MLELFSDASVRVKERTMKPRAKRGRSSSSQKERVYMCVRECLFIEKGRKGA